jgi:uncharacterized protein (TIGR02246 family)
MSTDEKAIRAVVDQWHRATAEGDVAAVLAKMVEDVMFLVPGQPPMEGRDKFEEGLRKVLASHRIDSRGDIQDIQVAGDLAYAMTLLTVRMIPLSGDQESVRSGHTLSIFRKQTNGAWLLARDANLLPPPGAEAWSQVATAVGGDE